MGKPPIYTGIFAGKAKTYYAFTFILQTLLCTFFTLEKQKDARVEGRGIKQTWRNSDSSSIAVLCTARTHAEIESSVVHLF